jgi:tight adherence protein C
MPALIGLVTFVAVTLLVSYVAQPRGDEIRRRILEGSNIGSIAANPKRPGPGTRLVRPVFEAFGSGLSRLLPTNMVRGIERTLIQGGEPCSLATFMAIWAIVTLAVVAAITWLITASGWGFLQLLLACLLIFFYGAGMPLILIKRRAAKRRKAIERALPDALDLLLTTVEAGLGVDAAIAMVAEKTRGPLSEKLTEYLKQVSLGQSRRDALDSIAERSGAQGLHQLANVVAQATTVGITMGDVLRLQAAELRTLRRLKAQETAARAPIWMTIPLALCFMPAMGAVIVVPSILHLLESLSNMGLRQ